MSDGGAATCCCGCTCPIPATWNTSYLAIFPTTTVAWRRFGIFGQGACTTTPCGEEERSVEFTIQQVSPCVVTRQVGASIAQNYTGFCQVQISGRVFKKVIHSGGLFPPYGTWEQERTFRTVTSARLSISPDGCAPFPHCDGWNNGDGCYLVHNLAICNFQMGSWTVGGELDAQWGCDSPNQIPEDDTAALHNSGGSFFWTSSFKDPSQLLSSDFHGGRIGFGGEFEGEQGVETPFVSGGFAVNAYIPREVGFIADDCYAINQNNPDFGVTQWSIPPSQDEAPVNHPICVPWSRDFLCPNGRISASTSYAWTIPNGISYS